MKFVARADPLTPPTPTDLATDRGMALSQADRKLSFLCVTPHPATKMFRFKSYSSIEFGLRGSLGPDLRKEHVPGLKSGARSPKLLIFPQ
jgi:hypothetical protein